MKALVIDSFEPQKLSNHYKLFILSLYGWSLIIFGFFQNSQSEILNGLLKIILSPDTLISDYMGVGNIGSAFVNAGCLCLILIVTLYRLKMPITGVSVSCLFTVTGVGFFGKNIFNIWFIILGVFLYAKYRKEPFSNYVYKAFYGTALAPVATEILFTTDFPILIRVSLAIIISLMIGFILPPVSENLLRVHQGFTLYNMGFTAGIIGVIIVSLLNSYGIIPIPQMIWTNYNNTIFIIYLLFVFLSMIGIALFLDRNAGIKVKEMMKYSGQFPTDFIQLFGFAPALMNMGINGCLSTFYVILVNGDFNGPTVGGILTVSGFSAFGKHPKNILPILIGVYLSTIAKPLNANDPSMLLTALFGTNLAPIAGKYGIFWGGITGFIHSSVVISVASGHGGLNLYNNGFAAGIVAATLLPIIKTFKPQNKI